MLGLVCCGSALAGADAGPATTPFPGTLSVQQDRLTAHVQAAPLHQVLAAIGRLSGAEVQGLPPQAGAQLVSLTWTDLPLTEALTRLLGAHNYLLFYTKSGDAPRLSRIWITAQGKGAAMALTPVPAAPPTPPSAAPASRPRQDEGVAQLTAQALQAPDDALRLDAVTRLGGQAAEDPAAKAILAQVAAHDGAPQVRAAAQELLESLP